MEVKEWGINEALVFWPRQRSDRWVYLNVAVVYAHVLQAHEGWADARRLQDQADA